MVDCLIDCKNTHKQKDKRQNHQYRHSKSNQKDRLPVGIFIEMVLNPQPTSTRCRFHINLILIHRLSLHDYLGVDLISEHNIVILLPHSYNQLTRLVDSFFSDNELLILFIPSEEYKC
jgi:hypothetical protein